VVLVVVDFKEQRFYWIF